MPILRLRREAFDLLEKAKSDPDNDELFREVIRFFIDNKLIDGQELAQTLTLTPPTVERWRNGTSSPHPAARPAVYKKLHSHLESQTTS